MKILIADDDPISIRILSTMLTKWGHEVVTTNNGLEAWQALRQDKAPTLAILDWMMPGLDGPGVCRQVRNEISTAHIYLILLTAMNRRENLVEGLEAGADDYLTKPFDRHELRVRLQTGARIVELQNSLTQRVRELEAAIIERTEAEEALRNLTLTDELTGLYNHRGFFTLAEHHAKTIRRNSRSSVLMYADMDGLKQINDTFGHSEGSSAIVKTAEILRQTFRDSDIVARLGGDEFAIIANDVSIEGSANITDRLQENLRIYNERSNNDYLLSLSIGAVSINHKMPVDIKGLVALADQAMYRNKRERKQRLGLLAAQPETRVWSLESGV